ncbi:MAG: ATP-binding protein, partial [Polyangiales bacterium]
MAALVGIATSKGLRFELGVDNTLGRGEDVTIVLADVLVSQRHAEIRKIEDGYRLLDLGATHGTFLNGERVTIAPLSDGDEIIVGATRLRFEDLDPRAVTPSDVSVASAGHVIQHRVPVTRARFPDAAELDLPAHARRDYERLRIAFEIGQALAVRGDLDDLLRVILERSFELVPAERGAILLRDPQTGVLEPRVASRRGGGTDGLVLPRSILEEVSTHRVGVLSTDASLDHRFGGKPSVMAEGVRAALCAPLVHGDDLVGVIYLDAQIAGVFGERDLDVIGTVAGQAALAVRTAQLRATVETKERIALVSQVAAGLAHDFANVLMVVLSRAEEIQQDTRVPPEHRENARAIETATTYAARLIRRFGGLTRGPSTERRAVDLTRFLADARDLMQQALGERITLVIESVDVPCPVIADPLELEQVLLNLVFNARDAMRGFGAFSIKLTRTAADGRAFATLLVADTGDGMPPEVVARAFDPFFTTKAAGRGTGMGLPVVRRLVTAAGGQISIDSRVGRGTTFRIDWPLTAAATPAGDAWEPIRAAGERVLVVDDDAAVRAAMVSALESSGYVVLQAADGEGGLAALADHPDVKLMVIDVVLVGMTGRQVAERARSLNGDLAVLYVSSFTEPAEVEEITARGAGFLAKPFTTRELVAKLQATLRGDAHEPSNRRIEVAASFADGAALLAGYDRG